MHDTGKETVRASEMGDYAPGMAEEVPCYFLLYNDGSLFGLVLNLR